MEIRLKKEFYSSSSIKKAIIDYSDIAEIQVRESDTDWLLIFSSCYYDQQRTIHEFENYLIALEN